MPGSTARLKTTTLSVLLYLAVWKILSLLIGRQIILPSPEQVLLQVIQLFRSGKILPQMMPTILRGLSGFGVSFILGVLCGVMAGISKRFRWFLNPLLISIRSIPVLSLILLAIIWFKTELVPVFICFLVVFPILTGSVASGVSQIDRDLLEMARIYRKTPMEIFKMIYLPSMLPFVGNAVSTGLGLTWKSVVAAEILSMPEKGMGTSMQVAQFQLDTPLLFAWTILIVGLSAFFEGIFVLLEKKGASYHG